MSLNISASSATVNHLLLYSRRSASIGSNCAALFAGYSPAATPQITSDPSASAADHGTSRGGSKPGILLVSNCCSTHISPADATRAAPPQTPSAPSPSPPDHGTSRGGSKPGILLVSNCCSTHISPADAAIPISPLMPVSSNPSQKNCATILRLVAPIAFST